jgi:hypothetical protein
MPRLKPLLKYPRISATSLRPGAALNGPPHRPFGSSGTVRLLPGWECLGWARLFKTVPPYDVAVYEKKECLPTAEDTHHQYGPGTYWYPVTEPSKMTIELS